MSSSGTSGAQAPGPAPSPPSFKPAEPVHGGLVQTSSDTMVPYTGGKPKVGFGDLDAEVKRTQTVSPGMLRPLGSSSSAKSQHYRITNNLDEKFQRNGNRIRYERLVMKHFERHGLDTITYVKGPDGDMLSIITDHAKFTLEEAEKADRFRQISSSFVHHSRLNKIPNLHQYRFTHNFEINPQQQPP